jgi:antitoxin component of RelBE/YafQ-DinJ toxin-antitoxin module
MKKITIRVDDELYRRARITAAERGLSLSVLVRELLVELGSAETDFARLEREERELRARIQAFSAGDRFSREEAHERGV